MSAGCCFGRGKQGECLGQVGVLIGSGVTYVVSEEKGPSIAKNEGRGQRGGCIFFFFFLGNGAGSVTGQQKEQCLNR